MMDEWIWTDPKRLACPECHGEGTLEETSFLMQSPTRDIGEPVIETVLCEYCGGLGEVDPPEDEEDDDAEPI